MQAINTGREDEFKRSIERALGYSNVLGNRKLHVMAGLIKPGQDAQRHRATYLQNLAYAAHQAAAHNITVVIEPINTRDMPGYFLSRTADARDVIVAVGEPNIGLQFDLYHRHVMEGGVTEGIESYKSLTRHYQCASPPDRGEPGAGDLDYAAIFRQIESTRYQGWIGCEYKPRGPTLDGLGWPALCGVTLG